jgi:hypothetical protein
MLILRGFKLFRLILVISVSLVSLITLPSLVQGDEWVKIGSSELLSQYYKPSSVEIDNTKKIIKVWVKDVYTDKGKNYFLRNYDDVKKQQYITFDSTLTFFLFNYKEWKYSIIHLIFYSKSGDILFDKEFLPKWNDIKSDTLQDKLFNKILQDYKIQR